MSLTTVHSEDSTWLPTLGFIIVFLLNKSSLSHVCLSLAVNFTFALLLAVRRKQFVLFTPELKSNLQQVGNYVSPHQRSLLDEHVADGEHL